MVNRLGDREHMRIVDVAKFNIYSPNPEVDRDWQVSTENLPSDFIIHRPRISIKAKQAPNLEILFHSRGYFFPISA